MSQATQLPEVAQGNGNGTAHSKAEEIVRLPGENPEQYALRYATIKFQAAKEWVTFFREVLGVGGVVRRTFAKSEELVQFEQTPEYAQIQQMFSQLRGKSVETTPDIEPTRVITVRLPKSVHESLKQEAGDLGTSMNKLCIAKLLRFIEKNPTNNGQM